uniref:Uncharacterized protein n=1 Tax=Anguilla anguilla TaxID=7936 RepID=A0A0E9QJ88_ANGAN
MMVKEKTNEQDLLLVLTKTKTNKKVNFIQLACVHHTNVFYNDIITFRPYCTLFLITCRFTIL